MPGKAPQRQDSSRGDCQSAGQLHGDPPPQITDYMRASGNSTAGNPVKGGVSDGDRGALRSRLPKESPPTTSNTPAYSIISEAPATKALSRRHNRPPRKTLTRRKVLPPARPVHTTSTRNRPLRDHQVNVLSSKTSKPALRYTGSARTYEFSSNRQCVLLES